MISSPDSHLPRADIHQNARHEVVDELLLARRSFAKDDMFDFVVKLKRDDGDRASTPDGGGADSQPVRVCSCPDEEEQESDVGPPDDGASSQPARVCSCPDTPPASSSAPTPTPTPLHILPLELGPVNLQNPTQDTSSQSTATATAITTTSTPKPTPTHTPPGPSSWDVPPAILIFRRDVEFSSGKLKRRRSSGSGIGGGLLAGFVDLFANEEAH